MLGSKAALLSQSGSWHLMLSYIKQPVSSNAASFKSVSSKAARVKQRSPFQAEQSVSSKAARVKQCCPFQAMLPLSSRAVCVGKQSNSDREDGKRPSEASGKYADRLALTHLSLSLLVQPASSKSLYLSLPD